MKNNAISKFAIDKTGFLYYTYSVDVIDNAGMAELADALDSGSSEGSFMQVQLLLPAPNRRNPNLLPIGEGFGFLFVFGDVQC